MKPNEIRLSPIVRFRMTFENELNLDKKGVFGQETYEKYIERHREASQKLEHFIRILCFQNALLFLVLNGQNWTLPIIGVQISEIPSIQEILLFSASMAFYFMCTYFVTYQCYDAIIEQFGNRIVNSNLIDPDFFNASRKHYDFFLKLYRPKLNIWGEDLYQHTRGFSIFSRLMNIIMGAVILIFPITHLALIGSASWQVYNSDWSIYAKWLLLLATAIINFGGIALLFGINKDFTFKTIELQPDDESLEEK
ncbi:hypothetical protein TH25_08135 [Thalassospira profundimaris]|uniref:Uncharacterized protein n=1 Tax=Thalassospira profundimaris TaxID=502049 RepID=A0A367XDA5_9PROT|nr:hypothetical protein TH25_08135 [Thalassospira profundimaris]